ncbi:MAG: flippase [Gemmatimonas sp.]
MSIDARRILRNVTSTAGLRIIAAAVSFGVFVLLARAWGQGRLGGFSTVLAYHTILLQAPLLGLHVPIVRDLAQKPERTVPMLSNALLIALGMSLLLAATMGLIGTLAYHHELQTAFWIAGISLVPSALTGVAETRLLSKEQVGTVAMMGGLETAVRAVGWSVVAFEGGGLTAAAWVLFLGRCVVAAGYLASPDFRKVIRFDAREIPVLKGLFALVPTFLGIHIVTVLLNRLDFVALSAFATLEDVGMYSAPYRIYEAAMMLPTIITVVLFPSLARMFGSDAGQFEALARQLCRACLVLGLPCSVILSAVAGPLLVAFYGAAFAPGTYVLAVLAYVPPIIAVDYALGISLHASHRQSHDLRVWIGALTVYALALVILVPRFGYTGAAVSTALTAAVQVSARYITVRREAKFASMIGLLLRPAAAAMVMASVIYLLRNAAMATSLLAGVAAYGVALFASRALTPDDVRHMRGMLMPAPTP